MCPALSSRSLSSLSSDDRQILRLRSVPAKNHSLLFAVLAVWQALSADVVLWQSHLWSTVSFGVQDLSEDGNKGLFMRKVEGRAELLGDNLEMRGTLWKTIRVWKAQLHQRLPRWTMWCLCSAENLSLWQETIRWRLFGSSRFLRRHLFEGTELRAARVPGSVPQGILQHGNCNSPSSQITKQLTPFFIHFQCKDIVEKSCFCGLQTKEVSCSKPFRCETKCKKLRNCKLHLCSRKCCDGQLCPPCDKICDKPLGCTKHKCKSMCHTGPCYPCNLKASLKCRCQGTVIEVSCGRAKKTKPPKCLLPCRKPSKCHHENSHNCHEGDCPPCNKICQLKNDTTHCEHDCRAKCHDSVLTRTVDKSWKAAGPWDVQPETVEFLKLPHPKCEVKVPVSCLGGHETIPWPCWDNKSRTCGRPCGLSLKCGNHVCTKECHPVNVGDDDGTECMTCEEQCGAVRPSGCEHPCRKPCHLPPCSPCTVVIKTQCHCGLVQMMFKCNDAFRERSTVEQNEIRKIKLMGCGNRCIKLVSKRIGLCVHSRYSIRHFTVQMRPSVH